MSSDDDDLMREFLVESRENLNQLDRDFVELEQNPRDPKLLGAIFRCVHTIKGTAGFLGLVKLESLTHIGESQLSRLRDGVLTLDSQLTSTLLAMVDAIRRILTSLEANGTEGDEDFTGVVEELSRIGVAPAPAAAAAAPEAIIPAAVAPAAPAPAPLLPDAVPAKAAAQPNEVAASTATALLTTAPATSAAAEHPVEVATKAGGVADTAIRVDVALLDRVMNLVGELVLARNQIMQFGLTSKDAGFINASQRLNLLTTELQAGVMKTRMQPIGNVWNRFPRIVRDLANVCGKKVTLELDGTETELDRTIIEAIKDPLTHAVRNAVDHGIENQERRRLSGKPAVGRVLLRAYHEGGQVNIEISDDGGGLPVEKIRARAIERGLVTAERAARMSEREVAHLIFLPGFSTAEQVTNVSGRGVGMDVVKRNINDLGGHVQIFSEKHKGSTIRIRLPLTLAILDGQLVRVGTEIYVISLLAITETIQIGAAHLNLLAGGTQVFRLRDEFLPVIKLSEQFGINSGNKVAPGGLLVVVEADDRRIGVLVDDLLAQQQVVVKSLESNFKSVLGIAGATILGDGTVALIIDASGLIRSVAEPRAGFANMRAA
jgi:two-component system chemotaxis sensor kinase CheA